ncbi:spermidine resistance protein [Agyrium rufum]|nr:spermidine resistance protein [Agyrium rufum]
MVNHEVPKEINEFSSPIGGTPQLIINREVTEDLDSTNAFEGPEKLLEVWFSSSASTLPQCAAPNGLKAVAAETWKEMLDLVNCQVLSIVESDNVDAYLLSESSMFVFPHKLILKTCGTTTLLCGLPRILEIAACEAGFPHAAPGAASGIAKAATPYRVFYSRKNFLFPDRQRGPHRSWRDEVKSLDRLFYGGSAYMIGKMNGEHWYLYLTEPNTILTPPATPDRAETETRFIDLPSANLREMRENEAATDDEDETLEILMTDLEEDNARQFYLENAASTAEGKYYQRLANAKKQARDTLEAPAQQGTGFPNLHDSGYISDKASVSNANERDVFDKSSSTPADLLVPSDTEPIPSELATEGHALGTVVSEASGLADVYPTSKYPDARIDAYLFTPCGFSANGVIPAPANSNAAHYFTVHVTPEPHCSFASFETNVPSKQSGRETAEVVEQVVDIFKPGRFSVTLFEAKSVLEDEGGNGSRVSTVRKTSRMDSIRGYRRVDRIVHELQGYELVFRYFERWDWEGGAPRLGEIGF